LGRYLKPHKYKRTESKTVNSRTWYLKTTLLYGAFSDKIESNCHFPACAWNFMTRSEAQQDFRDKNQGSSHKTIKPNYVYITVRAARPEVTRST
jgi:hypothetical protein